MYSPHPNTDANAIVSSAMTCRKLRRRLQSQTEQFVYRLRDYWFHAGSGHTIMVTDQSKCARGSSACRSTEARLSWTTFAGCRMVFSWCNGTGTLVILCVHWLCHSRGATSHRATTKVGSGNFNSSVVVFTSWAFSLQVKELLTPYWQGLWAYLAGKTEAEFVFNLPRTMRLVQRWWSVVRMKNSEEGALTVSRLLPRYSRVFSEFFAAQLPPVSLASPLLLVI